MGQKKPSSPEMPVSSVFLSDGRVRKPLRKKGAWLRKTLPFTQFSCLRAHSWSVGTVSPWVICACCLIVGEIFLCPNLRAAKGGAAVWLVTVRARWYGVRHHGGIMLNLLALSCRAGNRRKIHVVRCSPSFFRIGWGFLCERPKWAHVLRFGAMGGRKGAVLLLGEKCWGWGVMFLLV